MSNCMLRALLPALLSTTLLMGGSFLPARADEAADSVIQQAEQLSWNHKFKSAVDLLQAQLSKTPKDAALLTELAKIYQNLQKPKLAVTYLLKALQSDARQPERWSMLAEAYKELNDRENTIAAFEDLIEAAPDKPSVYEPVARYLQWDLHRPGMALAIVQQGLTLVKDPAPLLRLQGELLEGMEQYQDALAATQAAIKADPQSASWLVANVARLYIKLGQFDQALVELQKAHNAEENGAYRAQVSFASILRENGWLLRARAAYNKALVMDPAAGEVYTNLATMSSDEDKWADADAILQKGLQASGNKGEIYNALADLYVRQKKYDQARQMCNKALESDPDNITINALLGRMLVDLDRPDEALAAFKHAGKNEPDPEYYAYQQLINAYQSRSFQVSGSAGANDGKVAHYQELAVQKHADDPDMWEGLSHTYTRMAQFDKALDARERSYQLRGDPDGKALALLEVATSRKNALPGVEKGLFVLMAIAQAAPDTMLEPFRESPEMWKWLQQMETAESNKKVTVADVLKVQEQELKQAAELAPDNVKVLQALAEVQAARGQEAVALATWDKLAGIKKIKNPQAWALNHRADVQGQNLQYVISPSLVPLWDEIRKYKDVLAGNIEKLPPALSTYLTEQWIPIKQQLRSVVAQGRPDAARAVAMDPDSTEYYVTLARIDWFLERWDDVLDSLQHVEKLEAPPPPCQGDACAISNLLEPLKTSSDLVPEVYSMQYMILQARGDKVGALQALEHGAARRLDHPELRYRLARAYVEDGQPDKAIPVLEKLFVSSPYFRRQIRHDRSFAAFLQDSRMQTLLQ